MTFDSSQRFFTKLNLPPTEKDGALPIEKVQFDLRADEYLSSIDAISHADDVLEATLVTISPTPDTTSVTSERETIVVPRLSTNRARSLTDPADPAVVETVSV
jgi:hypothetical protein